MFLNAEKSQLPYPGPMAIFRPALPNCCTGEFGSCVIAWNALGLSHAFADFGPAFGFCPATKLGRFAENPVISGAQPLTDTSCESNTVNGVPLITVAIPFSCHPPNAC